MTPPPCYAHNPDAARPASYLWYTPIGNVVPLCGECCALWRADAAREGEDPMLKPLRITRLTPGDFDDNQPSVR